jgi:hypothetical protein
MKRRVPLIDWQRLTLNLRRHKPLAQCARALGCEQMTLQRLARGEVDEPRFELGLALLNLHLDICPQQHPALLRAPQPDITL